MSGKQPSSAPPPQLRVSFAGRSDPARERLAAGEPNQDSWRADERALVFAVADGVSGRPGGEWASALAVGFAEGQPPNLDEAGLRRAVAAASERIRELSRADPALEGAASTLTAIQLAGAAATVVHVGDSRAYLCRGGLLQRLTEDHTVAEELVALGRLSPEAALRHPTRSALSRSLGGDSAEPDLTHVALCIGDLLLLVTDGLFRSLGEARMQALAAADREPASLAALLLAEARARDADDDATALAVRVEALP